MASRDEVVRVYICTVLSQWSLSDSQSDETNLVNALSATQVLRHRVPHLMISSQSPIPTL
jgi:hypothetical protein